MNAPKKNIQILIADDSRTFLNALKAHISDYPGYEVLASCHGGQELLDHPMVPQADVVLLDIQMPQLNGFQTAKMLNDRHENKPVIAMTMHHEDVYLGELIAAGFSGFIYKPDVVTRLFGVIQQVLDGQLVFPPRIRRHFSSGNK